MTPPNPASASAVPSSSPGEDWVARARAEANDSAARAGVTVRPLTTPEVGDAASLLESIWGNPTIEPPLMVALSHSGAYVMGAFTGEQLTGVCIGYFASPLGEVLHSHVAGVVPGEGRRGVGLALKLHQRAWSLERGLTRITWTFDPLVARNAAFNLNRLGVDITDYLVDFYGTMSDGVNAGQGSDRLMARWQLDRELPAASASMGPGHGTASDRDLEASALLTTTADGAPHPHIPDPGARRLSVAIPEDIEELRQTSGHTAAMWRGAVRGALAPLLNSGRRIVGFHDHRYLLENR